jgi:hypothetical protein
MNACLFWPRNLGRVKSYIKGCMIMVLGARKRILGHFVTKREAVAVACDMPLWLRRWR